MIQRRPPVCQLEDFLPHRVKQLATNGSRRMNSVLWDTFTGSAPYRDVLLRTLHPAFIAQFGWNLALSLMPQRKHRSEAA